MLSITGTFTSFGTAHLTVIAVIAATTAALVLLGRRRGSRRVATAIRRSLAAVLVANEVLYWIWGLSLVSFGEFARNFLPLHVCGVAVFLTAWILIRPNQMLYEIAYYWGMGGTLQAILTPNLPEAFPAYHFFQFFISHGGIVVGVLFATLAMGMRPRKGSVLRIFLFSNAYLALVASVDWAIGANYMFLCQPPEGQSPFFFAPWPWYVLVLECIGLGILCLLYLPFYLTARSTRAPGGSQPQQSQESESGIR